MYTPHNFDFSLVAPPVDKAPETFIILDVQPLVTLVGARAQFSPGLYDLFYTKAALTPQHIIEHVFCMLPHIVSGSPELDDIMQGNLNSLAAMGIDITPIRLEYIDTIDAAVNFLIQLYATYDQQFLRMIVNRDLVACDFLSNRIVRASYS